ncbi:heavy metal translocating P-type ATPase [Bacillus sp. PS06]|uniref:heavy metal translocating P-type ATPase n=1 Tax=Bacillus sp. PS06 TaxID=2764176 RepID=UPI00177AA4EE|nr:heavy metal translocating P-type ATPase [Bacillus sp. PS06]MBD8069936.1 cadmium-translocating P-type ATPase [Bacillus sp. PS06]
MNSGIKALSQETEVTQNEQQHFTVLGKLKEHAELIAALVSGLLIIAGYILSKTNADTLSIVMFISAFVIGGFAKAKEGIEDTIESKELNVEMLMIFAAIGSAIIGYWMEGAILIFIFALSGALETYTMNKSHREISSLMELQPEQATLISNGVHKIVKVASLQIGDNILIRPGERVPADGKLVRGQTNIDESAISGESIPVSKMTGDVVFAGTVNIQGSITVEVTKESSDTLFQKIIQLVQNAQSEKSPSQLFIEKFEGAYVKCVLAAVALMMFLPYFLLGWTWTETFYRAMILLVVASPCALVASIMPATLSAISTGARQGILFKGGIHLEQLGNLEAIAFDKTGTLTNGKPEVTSIVVREGIDEAKFIQQVASIEQHSTHPLAKSIVTHAQQKLQLELLQPDGIEDIPGWGVVGTLQSREWKIGKAEFVGQELADHFQEGVASCLAEEGNTVVFASDSNGIIGLIALKDTIRKDTVDSIKALKKLGIHTLMLTGDSQRTASAIARECNIDGFKAECLPEQKVDYIKELKEKYTSVAMVGDGINDAPALATANVGIAMGEGTDVALETADIVLMKNDLTRIAEAVELSKRMNRIIKQNIIFSITVIMLLICSNFLQIIDLPFGVIGHEGSTILVILNGLRLLRSK